METLQYGVIVSADFSENTILLEMKESFSICAGEFALVKIDTLQQKIALEEFLKTLN